MKSLETFVGQASISRRDTHTVNRQITRGVAVIDTVLKDVLALTKLNYNACIHGDGLPVTLRFSDVIGSILTATENFKMEQRKFMYYI